MTAPPAVILAGGQATRLGGGDKCLLALGGQTLLARILATLRADAAAIAISANGDPARFAAYGCPVLPDGPHQGQGPLAGVLAALRWAAGLGAATVLTVPGDTPFIPAGLSASLAPAPACATSLGRIHPTVACWPVSAADALAAFLAAPPPYRVRAFGNSLGMRHVAFPGDPFTNINTLADLAAAREAVTGPA